MNTSQKPVVICITPVKNEAWILERFLQCASLWADHIILADQCSTDETVNIASLFPKVRLIENPSPVFNELERQSLLFNEARKIKGKRLIIALDADECLSANVMEAIEWNDVLNANEGTYFAFDWVNITPDLKRYWHHPKLLRGFMDDGVTDYSPIKIIHTEKIPIPQNAPYFHCKEIKLLHYQYTNWHRMQSKHNWYQVWERLHFPKKSPVSIYRKYHHMFAIPNKSLKQLQPEWFDCYRNAGINMFNISKEEEYYWDKIVMSWLREFGAKQFSKIDIWWKDWEGIVDPRGIWDKLLHRYLRTTQAISGSIIIRLLDKILKTVIH